MHPFTNNFENTLSKDSLLLAENWIANNAGTPNKWAPSSGDLEVSTKRCILLTNVMVGSHQI